MQTIRHALLIGLTLGLTAHAQAPTVDPTSLYVKDSIHGFTVLVHPDVLAQETDAAQMREELEGQLKRITQVMPAKTLSTLQKVRIWVEWERKKGGAAEFHPSAVWLTNHGYNPEKAGCIELSNTRNFVRWSRGAQPWMVMHELAHSHHNLVLGPKHEGIRAAYRQAVAGKLYDSVAHADGRARKAYAMANAKEYYAELSEAYFGRNDFYPFTRAELETHDPVGYRLMQTTWVQAGREADGPTPLLP